jgi:D-alanine-D-alanine ligase
VTGLALYIATPPATVPPNEWGKAADVASVAQILASTGLVTNTIAVPDAEALESIPSDAFVVPNGRFVPGSPHPMLLMQLLEERSLPYMGSGPDAVRTAYDKSTLKHTLRSAGIATPSYCVVDGPDAAIPMLGSPCVVKLARSCESFGVEFAATPLDAVRIAVKLAGEYLQPVVIEEYIRGREFTVALLGNRPTYKAFPVEIRRPSDRQVIDSSLKSGSLHSLVRLVDEDRTRDRLSRLACAVGDALDLTDWARIDVLEGDDGVLHVIDVNTLPGLRQSPENPSLLPYMIHLSLGVDYRTLVTGLVGISMDRHGILSPPDIETARARLLQ